MNGKLRLNLNNLFYADLKNYTNKIGTSKGIKYVLFCSALLFSTVIFGQASPGGVALDSVAIWLKADADVDTSMTNQNVNTWLDQGTYTIDGSSSGNERPKYSYKDNNFNPSIDFRTTGTPDQIDLGDADVDSLMMGSKAFHIYAVANVDSTVSGVLFSDKKCSAPATAGYNLLYDSATKKWVFSGSSADNTSTVTVNASKSSTDYSLVSLSRLGQAYTLKNNEDSTGTATSNAPINYASTTPDFSERWLGTAESGCSGLNNFKGNLSELIVVRHALTPAEDKRIKSYLALKYGLTLPSSSSSYTASNGTPIWNNTTYWHDVAGIGRDDASGLDQRISKSADKSAIVTIATDNDFTSANTATSRSSLATDESFMVWGNNDIPASNGWTTTGAPANFVILPQVWRVKETGTVGALSVQVNTMNSNNLMPTFVDSLFLVHGPSPLGSATPKAMTLTSPGVWTITGVDFANDDFFSFAVKNKVVVEFSSDAMTSIDEMTASPFPNVLLKGTINLPTSFNVWDDPITATPTPSGTADYTYVNDTIILGQGIYSAAAPITLLGMTLVDDFVDEGGAADLVRFLFNLTGTVGVATGNADGMNGTYATHLYTITDDDTYNVEIAPGTNGVEGSTDVTFVVQMAGGTQNLTGGPITGTISLSGEAQSGTDYAALGAGPHFTIPDMGTSDVVTISISDDLFLEGTETLIGQVATVSAGASITGSPVTATITDDELTNVQIVVGNPVDANEGASLSYTVSLAGGVTNHTGGPITGAITYGGSATTISDYVPTPSSFTIANLQMSSAPILVFAIDDEQVELTESVTASISMVDIDGSSYSSPSSATANIIDQDNIGLTISVSSSVNGVSEGVGNLTYNLLLDNNKINGTGSPITGVVTLSGTTTGPAGSPPPIDYTDVTTFSIPTGSGVGTIVVPIIDDGANEGTETLIATISSPTPFGTPNLVNNGVSVNIFDNDSGGIQISIDSPTNATETNPTGSATVTFEVSIVSGGTSAADISGTINYSGGTAVIGSDFDTTGASVFVIPAGLTSTIVSLPVINDFNSEPQETVVATFVGNPTSGIYVNTTSTAYINDDDAANLIISIDTLASGVEGGSNVFFVVSLGIGELNGTGNPITGNLSLGGTASSADYSYTPPFTYSIGNNQNSDTVELVVTNDFNVEYTETVVARILTASIGNIADPDSAVAFIHDNELPSLALSILSPIDGEEGVDDVKFTVAIENGWINDLGQPITGDLTYSGTASSGDDYTEVVGFSIPNGLAFAEHSLPVTNDLNIENMESVTIKISNPNEGTISIDSVVTANIIDDDLVNAKLIITSTIDGIESPLPTPVEYVISFQGGLQNQTGSPISGTLGIGGSATDGVDYFSITTFSIADSSLSDLLEFTVLDDNLEEGIETVIATLLTTTIGTFGADSVAIANILDDDTDTDHDGLSDVYDSDIYNIDSDCDGIFDGCDYDPHGDGSYLNGTDFDGDGINDACDADTNNDGTIDNGPDINNDGLNDLIWDPTDDDGDLLPNHVDTNDNNEDTDGDGITDGADVDANGDGTYDNGCDMDDDGIHDDADADDDPEDGVTDAGKLDDDNDGVVNKWDMTPLNLDGTAINYIVSPNGDNINETLRIPGIKVFKNHELVIYNRWGAEVYRSTKYNNDWAGEPINEGMVIGSDPMLEGTYFYVLDLGEDGKEPVRGFIEIRR